MGLSLGRGSDAAVIDAINQRLDSLGGHCLADLVTSLEAMRAGDLTRTMTPVTTLIPVAGDSRLDEVARKVNGIIEQVQAAVEAYNSVRAEYARGLGDQSSLNGLQERLDSLTNNCLAGLTEGLACMSRGDLTHGVTPVTTPITGRPGASLGTLAETFNVTLDRMQSAIGDYNAMRGELSQVIGGVRELADSVARRC
jgi:methyl-accepting chemotaxis protein